MERRDRSEPRAVCAGIVGLGERYAAAFCVVGEAHLTGDRGVLDLLGKRGYVTKRVTQK